MQHIISKSRIHFKETVNGRFRSVIINFSDSPALFIQVHSYLDKGHSTEKVYEAMKKHIKASGPKYYIHNNGQYYYVCTREHTKVDYSLLDNQRRYDQKYARR